MVLSDFGSQLKALVVLLLKLYCYVTDRNKVNSIQTLKSVRKLDLILKVEKVHLNILIKTRMNFMFELLLKPSFVETF